MVATMEEICNRDDLSHHNFHTGHCYGCNPENEYGLQLKILYDKKNARTYIFEYIFSKYQEGLWGYVHGGVLASIFDELQGALCHYLGYRVMTKKIDILYLKATPIKQPVHFQSSFVIKGKKTLETRAIANASWYILPDRILKRLLKGKNFQAFQDFQDNWDSYHSKGNTKIK